MIIDTIEQHSEELMPKIYQRLKRKGITCHINTFRSRVKQVGIQQMASLQKTMLNEDQRLKRKKWTEEHMDFDWDKVIFTDDSSFFIYTKVPRVWRRRGEKKIIRTFKYPSKVHIWGCLSMKGFGNFYVFKKNLNADLMCKIYEKKLYPTAKKWFGEDTNDWYLQEDNDPKHTSKKCNSW